MRYMYPAIFTCKRDKHMIVADFPDIAGCRAYGHTMEEAMESARVALCRTLLELEERSEFFPPPSDSTLLRLQNRGCTICVVVADTRHIRLDRELRMKEAASWNQKKHVVSHGSRLQHLFEFKG